MTTGATVADSFTRYVITLTRNPGKPREQALIKEHVAFLQKLEREGHLVLAGPFEDGTGGMIIVRASSRAAAQAMAEADPFVTSGDASATVRTWLLSCAENNHMGLG